MPNSGKNERVFDQRVVHRYIATGRVTREEYEEHLASLPDVAENVKARDEGGDEDGYDRPIAAANEPSRRPLGLLPLASRPSYDDDDDDDDDLDDDDDDLDDDDDDDDDDDAADAGETAPESGPPVSGTPASGTPVSGSPVSGTPVSGTPVTADVAEPSDAGQPDDDEA